MILKQLCSQKSVRWKYELNCLEKNSKVVLTVSSCELCSDGSLLRGMLLLSKKVLVRMMFPCLKNKKKRNFLDYKRARKNHYFDIMTLKWCTPGFILKLGTIHSHFYDTVIEKQTRELAWRKNKFTRNNDVSFLPDMICLLKFTPVTTMHFCIWLRKGPNYWEGRGAEVTL